MNILVLGANGMAGHTIVLYLSEQGHDVTAFTRQSISFCKKNIIGDAFDTEYLKKIVVSDEFDAIINCIGILNQNADSNPLHAIYLNSLLPHLIVETISKRQTKLIQISTDCVFSGKNGPYKEDSFKDGETIYDRTKALGEVNDDKNLTFRNSIIGPDINDNGIGLFNWFMKQKNEIFGYTNAIWTGVTTLTLAKAIEQAINENLTGLYNLVNNTNISKYNLLELFNKYFKDNSIQIIPNDTLKLDKSLICTRQDFNFKIPSYEEMVMEMKDWIIHHKHIYKYKI